MGPQENKQALQIPATSNLSISGNYIGHWSEENVTLYLMGRVDSLPERTLEKTEKTPDEMAKVLGRFLVAHSFDEISKVRGQFTVAARVGEETLGFRSKYSPHSLYFNECGVSNQLIFFRDKGQFVLDEEYFARFLISPRGLQTSLRMTPLKGVNQLAMGDFLRVSEKKVTLIKGQMPSVAMVWDESQDRKSVSRQIDQLLHEIVEESLVSHPNPAACELSGGLDSSYINCLVAEKQSGHPAVMYAFSERASHRFSETCAALLAEQKNIQLKIVDSDELDIPDLRHTAVNRNEPVVMFWQGELFGPVLKKNIPEESVLLTGFGSDQIFLRITQVLPYLIRTKRWKAFWKTSGAMGKALERSRVNLIWQSLIYLVPPKIRSSVNAIFRKLKFNPFNIEDIAADASAVDLAPWMKEGIKSVVDYRPVPFENLINQGYLQAANAVMGPYLEQAKIKYVHPYCDSRLVEFVREKVSGHLIHDFSAPYKNLLRLAQEGTVPEEVRTRPKNEFHFDGFQAKVFRKNNAYLRELINEPLPVGAHLIDRDKLLTAFEQLQFGVGDDSTYFLTRLIAYLAWWKSFTQLKA